MDQVSHELSASQLSKTIFKADSPEQYVRSFSPQSLYLTIKHNGLESSTDLLSIATVEQCRAMLDLDLWSKNELSEDALWQWLALSDEDDSLKLLQKILKCIDLKLIALMIARHITVVIFDEKTDEPPGAGFYTPDQGMSWLGINIEDPSRHRLFGKLLALILETNTELFYQLLAIPQTHTEAMLEEESLSDRQKRLAAEGIPELEFATSLHAPITAQEVLDTLKGRCAPSPLVSDIHPVEPLIYDSTELHPLRDLLHEAAGNDTFQAELTLLMNGAIVFFNVDFSNNEEVRSLTQKVRGAINIGLQLLTTLAPHYTAIDLYRAVGLTPLYRVGLAKILKLRHEMKKIAEDSVQDTTLLTLQALRARFPELPEALAKDGTFTSEEGRISAEMKPFEQTHELELVRMVLTK